MKELRFRAAILAGKGTPAMRVETGQQVFPGWRNSFSIALSRSVGSGHYDLVSDSGRWHSVLAWFQPRSD